MYNIFTNPKLMIPIAQAFYFVNFNCQSFLQVIFNDSNCQIFQHIATMIHDLKLYIYIYIEREREGFNPMWVVSSSCHTIHVSEWVNWHDMKLPLTFKLDEKETDTVNRYLKH
jgi:hypothetical protein